MQSFSRSLQVVGVLRLWVASLVEQLACDIGVQSAGENKAVEEANWNPYTIIPNYFTEAGCKPTSRWVTFID